MDALFELLSESVFPRMGIFWGESLDIDDDNYVNILLSSRINATGTILGFFNPLDCFVRNMDPLSEDYNPGSNETDIIYTAIPVENDDIYSVSGIAATIAHELRHLVHFQRKTLFRLRNGESDVPQEESFLDEGLSHLAESLCGLGESGGNLAFVEAWLNDTASISLGGYDLDGGEDSAGKRGGMAVLLWEAISECSNVSREMVLKEFCASINRGRCEGSTHPSIIVDQMTGEPISISVFFGDFPYNGKSHELAGPRTSSAPIRIAPLGLAFYDVFFMESKSELALIQSEAGRQIVWGFAMY